MLSNKSSAVWASATSTQGVGETDWTAYQLSLTGNSQQFSLVPGQSTSTSLVTYDGYYISSGQGMLLSTNGTSFTSGNAGAVTTTASTFPTPTVGTNATSPIITYSTATTGYGSYMKPDGTRLWISLGSSPAGTIIEYTLTTPFDVTTATANGRTFSTGNTNTVYGGLCFSYDGQYMYYCTYNSATTLYVVQLSTAWDITTAGTPLSYTLPGTAGNLAYCTSLQISNDGTKLIQGQGYTTGTVTCGAINVYSFPTPYSPVGATALYYLNNNAYTNIGMSAGSNNYPMAVMFTPDGKTLVNVVALGATAVSIYAYTCSTPWNPQTLSVLGSVFSVVSSSTTGNCTAVMNQNGTYVGIIRGPNTNGSASTAYNVTVDVNTKYNINISSFGLSTAPTQAYYAAPSVSVDMESQANRVNMYPYQLDFTSATTTQAIVNAYGNASGGVLQTGDAILLNGTTSVTTTNVVQGTANAVAAKNLGKADNYISYSGKFTGIGGSRAYSLRFSPDGSSFICVFDGGTYDNRIVQFGLTTPWDISTSYGPIGIFNPAALTPFNSSFGAVSSYGGGCEFNSDGSKLIFIGTDTTNFYAVEYNLGQNYRISTVRSVASSTAFGANASIALIWGGRFNLTGTQFYCLLRTSSSYYINVSPCATPYSTAGISYGTSTNVGGTSNNAGYQCQPLLEPNGNFVICSYNGLYTGEQTVGTNNNLTTTTFPINLGTSTNAIVFSPGFTSITAQDFSVDGTKYYCYNGGYVYQFNVRTLPLTQYTCSFATQGSAPTSVFLPDRSTAQTITTAASGGNMTFSAPLVTAGGRAVAMKITSPYINTTITNATLALYKS